MKVFAANHLHVHMDFDALFNRTKHKNLHSLY